MCICVLIIATDYDLEILHCRADGLQHDNDVLEKKLKDCKAMMAAKDAQYVRIKKERDDFCAEIGRCTLSAIWRSHRFKNGCLRYLNRKLITILS